MFIGLNFKFVAGLKKCITAFTLYMKAGSFLAYLIKSSYVTLIVLYRLQMAGFNTVHKHGIFNLTCPLKPPDCKCLQHALTLHTV